MSVYPEPLICALDMPGAVPLAGGPAYFSYVRMHARDRSSWIVPAADLSADVTAALCNMRAPLAGLRMDRPHLMGILNTTPDSFSDGGKFNAPSAALTRCRTLAQDGATILDIGGESTRPGATFVRPEDEIARTAPIIDALCQVNDRLVISIDTRKASVAQAAVEAGARLINDVSAMQYDPRMCATMAAAATPVCLMHAQGEPETMQKNPHYSNVLLDVFDFLRMVRDRAVSAGISAARILLDPGIGFGKTLDHNLILLRHLPLFHALGCPLVLGASRKRFIGTLTGVADAADRLMGSVALALHGAACGVQVLRVHDVAQTRQALAMRNALFQPETRYDP